MPEPEREKFRSFHDELQKRPDLRASFDTYFDWLATLPRPDRDELRFAKSATDRVSGFGTKLRINWWCVYL